MDTSRLPLRPGERDLDERRLRMLRGVGQGLADDEVGRDLDRLREPRVGCEVEVDGDG
jgi:hypothetical protein